MTVCIIKLNALIIINIASLLKIGAVVQLQNSTYFDDEGDEISVCAELVSVDGGLRTPLSLSWTILNGTAECETIRLALHT